MKIQTPPYNWYPTILETLPVINYRKDDKILSYTMSPDGIYPIQILSNRKQKLTYPINLFELLV